MTELLPAHEESTGPQPRASVLWLHGLGADGFDFAPFPAQLRLPFASHWVFPHAPCRAVTVNAGMVMPAWFDIHDLSGRFDDHVGLLQAVRHVEDWLLALRRQHPAATMLLGGFSQGGALALASALLGEAAVDGVVALSSWLTPSARQALSQPAPVPLPFFLGHGAYDEVVPAAAGEDALQQLITAGHAARLHRYAMAHAVCAQEMDDLRTFLTEVAGA